ncbi:hypothetical protein [Winogradskyella forsetii]|nr:hypothetical protein [Winogradskyella forsetii]
MFVIVTVLLFTKTAFSQGGSSTEFEIEITLFDLPKDDEYEFYYMGMPGVNSISSCYYEKDSLNKNVKFYGHINYIVDADNLTFIIAHKTKHEKALYSNKQVVKNYIVNISKLNAIGGKINAVKLNRNKPFIKIGAKVIDTELEIYTKYYSNISEVEDMANIIDREWITIEGK